MGLQDLLDELRIDKTPEKSENGSYVIDLDNTKEWFRFYTRLSNSHIVEEDQEASNVEAGTTQFIGDDLVVTLTGDVDTDEYKIIIREL